jgi:hypothetical protein
MSVKPLMESASRRADAGCQSMKSSWELFRADTLRESGGV